MSNILSIKTVDDLYISSFEMVLELLPIYREVQWVESELNSGGALHIVIEDGNYEDDNVLHCINRIESGDYVKFMNEYADTDGLEFQEDQARQLKLAKDLLDLPENVREMVCEGKTMTEELFNHLYNGDPLECLS